MKKHYLTSILVIILALSLVFTFASCGNVENDNCDDNCESSSTPSSGAPSTSCDHAYGEWTVEKGSCYDHGSKSAECTKCGETKTEVVGALGHSFNDDNHCTECNAAASEGLSFVSNGDGTCYLNSIGSCTDLKVVIPSKSPEGDTVTSIGDYAFYDCGEITGVEIPMSVTTLGKNAFERCFALSAIVIPDGVTSIGSRAFANCGSLTEVVIGSGVTYIGDKAFLFCVELISFEFRDTEGWSVSQNADGSEPTAISPDQLGDSKQAHAHFTGKYKNHHWFKN